MARRIISGICVIFLLTLSFTSCMEKRLYRFLHDEDEILTIEIVRLGSFDNQRNKFNEQVLVCVDDHDTFLAEFAKIPCYKSYSPDGVRDNTVVIKITYMNEEYELIGASGQSKYIYSDGQFQFQKDVGKYDFDYKLLDEFLQKYLIAN